MNKWLLIPILLLTGCATTPKGMVVTPIAVSEKQPRTSPKTHFDPGEVPTLCVYGYEGKHVDFDVVDLTTGMTNLSGQADIPKRTFEGQQEQIYWVNISGQVYPQRKVQNLVKTTDLLVPLSLPDTSTYEARLKVDGKTAKTVRFNVEWKPIPARDIDIEEPLRPSR